jgi:hypothetical protein
MCLPVNVVPDEDTAFAEATADSARNSAAETREDAAESKKGIDLMKIHIAELRMKQQSEIARRGGSVGESDVNIFTEFDKRISRAEKAVDTAERCLEEAEEFAIRAESVANSLDFYTSQQTPRPVIEKYLNAVGW